MAEISETEKEKIRKQAKEILDNFSKALDKVKEKPKKEKKKAGGYREEGPGKVSDPEFKRIMFENAPMKDENNILAEKKAW